MASGNPSAKWPGTIWQQITGYFLRAANDTGTGGSDTTVLTLEQLPKWSAQIGVRPGSGDTIQGAWGNAGSVATTTATSASGTSMVSQSRSCKATLLTFSFGGGQSHSNMPKYQDVYVWRRTA